MKVLPRKPIPEDKKSPIEQVERTEKISSLPSEPIKSHTLVRRKS